MAFTERELRRKYPNASDAFVKRNALPMPKEATANPAYPIGEPYKLASAVSTDEAKLNKTERAYLEHLQAQNYAYVHVQAITLKLAFDTRLTPDFAHPGADGRVCFVDVKGFQREDALIKMRVAARLFAAWACFVIVKRIKGEWIVIPVKA